MVKEPRSVIIKTLVTKKNSKTVFKFFTNLKNWEYGGALKNIQKDKEGWWVCDSPFGKAKMKLRSNEKFGILDHDFISGSIEWTVFSRVTQNGGGSTVSWVFIRPEIMTHKQFEKQLQNFDNEIEGMKTALES